MRTPDLMSTGTVMDLIEPDIEGVGDELPGVVRQVPQSVRSMDEPKPLLPGQTEDEDAGGRIDCSGHGTESPSTAPNAQEVGRSLYAAEVMDAEFVASTVDVLGWRPRGVRILLEPIDSSGILPWAELYFPVNYREGSKMREAVEKILGRKMTSAEIYSHRWRSSLIGRRCHFSATLGVEHSEGRPLKFKFAVVHSGIPAET